jgi:competence protein ComEA
MTFIKTLAALVLTVFALHAHAAVDANRATPAEMEAVKGLGPALSARIVKAREAGAFKDWNDMVERVQGMGPGNAARPSEAGLTVGGKPFAATAAGTEPKARKERTAAPATR